MAKKITNVFLQRQKSFTQVDERARSRFFLVILIIQGILQKSGLNSGNYISWHQDAKENRSPWGLEIDFKAGTIQGIVGENGAGKSTLMSILYGFYQCDSESIEINGEHVEFDSSATTS